MRASGSLSQKKLFIFLLGLGPTGTRGFRGFTKGGGARFTPAQQVVAAIRQAGCSQGSLHSHCRKERPAMPSSGLQVQ